MRHALAPRTLALAALLAPTLLALGACGQRAPLKPAPGKSMPVAPYGREDAPSADDLTGLPTQISPSRNDELRRKSEPRADDPFDLPPEE